MAKRLLPVGLSGEAGLALAVIELACRDLASDNGALRKDAAAFFAGSWFVDLCDFLEVPPDWRPTI